MQGPWPARRDSSESPEGSRRSESPGQRREGGQRGTGKELQRCAAHPHEYLASCECVCVCINHRKLAWEAPSNIRGSAFNKARNSAPFPQARLKNQNHEMWVPVTRVSDFCPRCEILRSPQTRTHLSAPWGCFPGEWVSHPVFTRPCPR